MTKHFIDFDSAMLHYYYIVGEFVDLTFLQAYLPRYDIVTGFIEPAARYAMSKNQRGNISVSWFMMICSIVPDDANGNMISTRKLFQCIRDTGLDQSQVKGLPETDEKPDRKRTVHVSRLYEDDISRLIERYKKDGLI